MKKNKEFQIKEENIHRNILICVYGFYFMCIVCGIFLWNAYRERNFSSKEWMKCDPAKRYLYMDDFQEKHNIIGMYRSEIDDLLGSPTWTETERGTDKILFYEYRIKDTLLAGWKVYQLRFQDDIVIGAIITIEDW